MRLAPWKNKVLVTFIFIIIVNLLQAQTTIDTTYTKKKKVSFEKSIFVGSDFNDHLLIGFSGPQLMFSINEHTKFGPCYYPSLWWNYKTGELDTKLGVGARVDHKHAIIGFNTFRVGNNKWIGALVLGVRF
jgi:hypothetical protein